MNEAIKELMEQRQEHIEQLHDTEDVLKQEIIASAEFKVGDVVVIITPAYKAVDTWHSDKPEVRRVGQVRSIKAILDTGTVFYDIAPKTKHGFHAVNSWHIHNWPVPEIIELYVETK